MSVTLRSDLILAEIDVRSTGRWKDKITGSEPDIWKGTDLGLRFMLYAGNKGRLVDVSVYDTLTLQVRESDEDDADVYVEKTISGAELNNALTADQWEGEESFHGEFQLSFEETTLPLGIEEQKDFWMVIAATTVEGKHLVLGCTSLTVKRSGFTTGQEVAPKGDPNFLNENQIRALIGNYLQPVLKPGQTITVPTADNTWRLIIRADIDPITGQPTAPFTWEQVQPDP
jgi:hypothetical protein